MIFDYFLSLFAAKTPETSRTKKPLSKSLSTENEDVKSNSSSTTSMSRTPRKTPAQVKAKSAARKEKVSKMRFGNPEVPGSNLVKDVIFLFFFQILNVVSMFGKIFCK